MATKKKTATEKPAIVSVPSAMLAFDAKVIWHQEHQAEGVTVLYQTKLYAEVNGHGVLIELATKEKRFESGRTYHITIAEN